MISHTCCLNTIFHNICDNVDQILEQVLFMNHANPQIFKQNWRKNYHSSNKLTIDYQIYSEQRPQLIKNGDRRSKNGFFAIFGAKYIKNYFFANFGATNEYTSTWQKQNPILFCKKTTKDAKKTTIDGPKTDILLFSGPNILKNYFLANFGATNEYTSTWQKQNPILFCNKTTKDAKKPTIDGPKTDFSMKNWDFSGSPYWRKKKKFTPKVDIWPIPGYHEIKRRKTRKKRR